MPEYRFYTIKKSGHITAPPSDHQLPDDETAVQEAKMLLNSHAIEIWHGPRVVAYLAPEKSDPTGAPEERTETAHSNSEEFLETISITTDLWARQSRPPNVDEEISAMTRLADTLSNDPSKVFQICVEEALSICRADTCGISLREKNESGEDIFRWIALTGQLKEHLNGTTPRYFSPCGICVELASPVLMKRPELHYSYLNVGPAFEDVLLIPLTEKGSQLEGTIWIVAHNKERKFDSEDARVMQRLAVFTATALQLAKRSHEATAQVTQQQLLFHEFDHRVKNTLMMTAGLLRHQLRHITSLDARIALGSAAARVSTIGQVHQIANGSTNGNLADVIEAVCADLIVPDGTCDIKVEAEPLKVSAQKAMVVALIANELLTNAIKHGVRDHEDGKIEVIIFRDGDYAQLSITDNGVPIQPTGPEKQGLGMSLISRLADQLGGRLTIDNEPKRFSVKFPIAAL